MNKARVLAFYLPQYHPIPENDKWWGKGFTEWTNVGKAKPLFKGHDQPKIPADLGYYDLRLPEIREAQAEMAKKHGVEGFCYWHYWFGGGRRLLERPFNEVLALGKPDFPFCLAWANHSWEDKLFNKEGTKKLLIEQTYPGDEDYILHFNTLLPAFKDARYVRVNDKPLFMVYNPFDLPDMHHFIELWNKLAIENGLGGIHFVAQTYNIEDIDILRKNGFDAVNIVRLFHFFKKDYSLIERAYLKIMRIAFKTGRIVSYKKAAKWFSGIEDKDNTCYPCLIPGWDHSPRSGKGGHILVNPTPEVFSKHVQTVVNTVKDKPDQEKIVFLRSWNEWAEGNYMEPDIKHGHGFLDALKKNICD